MIEWLTLYWSDLALALSFIILISSLYKIHRHHKRFKPSRADNTTIIAGFETAKPKLIQSQESQVSEKSTENKGDAQDEKKNIKQVHEGNGKVTADKENKAETEFEGKAIETLETLPIPHEAGPFSAVPEKKESSFNDFSKLPENDY